MITLHDLRRAWFTYNDAHERWMQGDMGVRFGAFVDDLMRDYNHMARLAQRDHPEVWQAFTESLRKEASNA